MPVFRVEKNKGYTVMSNHHLRNKDLSLKAKGLLSQMLSLPEDWDYTLKGLALINREKIDAIRQAIRELEQAGYIVRSRERDERGRLRGADYVIYEQPQTPPALDLPTLENPTLDNPTQEKPTLENPTQLNKDRVTKDQSITDPLSTHSIPSLSPPPAGTAGAAASPPERKRTEAATQSAVEIYRDIIKENIEYDHLLRYSQIDPEELDGIVELLVETICTARKTIRVAGDDYPAELVKAKLLKLNSGHIEFVMDCMRQNTTKIRNIKKYLLAVLFNAPSTMGSYYTALVAHDMAEGKI
ncbi:MAG: helix-turn-helix domain-containing protein [Clostridia bacterium]|nr:helix-turn-helix domain-containing protein [Clostridia bacterium]